MSSGTGIGTAGAGGTTGNFRSGNTGPAQSNILAPYYVNPLAAGLPNNSLTNSANGSIGGGATGGSGGTAKGVFGQPLFSPANTSLSSANAGRGGGFGNSGMGNNMASGRTTAMSVGPRYTQGLGWQAPVASPARLQTQLQSLVVNSPRLASARGIQVVMDGSTVVLRGTTADEHDRALAGAMVGLTPGVYGVRNEIKVAPPAATPASGQQP